MFAASIVLLTRYLKTVGSRSDLLPLVSYLKLQLALYQIRRGLKGS